MREHVEAIRAIWTQEQASYHGAHVDLSNAAFDLCRSTMMAGMLTANC